MPATATEIATALRAQINLRPGERLYGIVDAAQDASLAFEAEERFGVRIRSLFRGEAAQFMREFAPYLIPIDPASAYLDHWAERWGKNVGILLTSFADPDKLFRHLREIFVVKDEEGQKYFFRYYDPRVLTVYLPTCTPEDSREFFGPIQAIFIEGNDPGSLTRFAPIAQTESRTA